MARSQVTFAVLGGVFALTSCGEPRQQSEHAVLVLGPDAHPTQEVTQPTVRYRLGDPEGPGMIFQGSALAMAPALDEGILVFTAYFSDGPIQLFRKGRLDQVLGRRGSGPGEFQTVSGLVVNPSDGAVWFGDGLRMTSFRPDGSPGPTLNASHAGSSVWDRLFLPDGSLLLVGTGGTADNFGFLLHRYNFGTRTWTSHHPEARDEAFVPHSQARMWQRRLALSPDGMVLLTSHDYEIQVLDPSRDFEITRTVVRRPPGWPEDPGMDQSEGRLENRFYPGFGIVDTWSDPDGLFWVITAGPRPNWQDDIVEDPDHHGMLTLVGPDYGMKSLVEVFDPHTWNVLGSFKFPTSLRYIVGPGLVARYGGDFPYPHIEVLEVPFEQE